MSYTATKVDENLWRAWTVAWTLTDADEGSPWKNPGLADRSVAVTGTFGGATVTLQGSNDGTNWFTLKDPLGNNLTWTSSTATTGLKQIGEITLYLRPITAGGTGTSVVVTVLASSTQRNT